jgi:threonine dehydrogenase-like Zn-dependent dehydrogenase
VVGDAVTGLVRAAGVVVMVALFERDVTIDFNVVVRKEVTVVGSYAYTPRDVEEAFQPIATQRVDVEQLVTPRKSLTAINEAFAVQLGQGRFREGDDRPEPYDEK